MNNAYSSSSSPPPVVPPPPLNQTPGRQQTLGVQLGGFVQRSEQSLGNGTPPPLPRHPHALLTQRLDWQRDDWNQQPQAPPAVHAGEFYRQVPGAAASQDFSPSRSAGSMSNAASSATSAFYSFAVSNVAPAPEFFSPVSYSPPLIQPRVSSASYFTSHYDPVPTPPLPPKPDSISKTSVSMFPSRASTSSPPPIPPRVKPSPPSSAYNVTFSRPPTPPARPPPEYTNGNSGGSYFPVPFEKGTVTSGSVPTDPPREASTSRSDDEDIRQAILASQESHRLENQRLLIAHMSTLGNRDAGLDEDFIVRESDDDDFERLTPLDGVNPFHEASRGLSHMNSEEDLLRRVTKLSLMETGRNRHAADDGWETYDPRAFEDQHSNIVSSPAESESATPLPHQHPHPTLPTGIPPLSHPPSHRPLHPALSPPAAREGSVERDFETRHLPSQTVSPIEQTSNIHSDSALPAPSPHRHYPRSQPSSPPTARPELPNHSSAPAAAASSTRSKPLRPIPSSHSIRPEIHHQGPSPRSHSPLNPATSSTDVFDSPSASLHPPGPRERILRSSASHGNLPSISRAQMRAESQLLAPPTPPLPRPASSSFSKAQEVQSMYTPTKRASFIQSETNLAELSTEPAVLPESENELRPSPSPSPSPERARGHGRSRSKTGPPSPRGWSEDADIRIQLPDREDFSAESGSGEGEGEGSTSLSVPEPSRPPLASLSTMSYLGNLMDGVSFGFGRAEFVPRTHRPDTQHPFPDIIGLTPNQAFYIATPTFRQLLRLLANLGHGKIEPDERQTGTVYLRPTLQFVQVRPQEDLYTVLWLELEKPLLPGMHSNGDTSVRGYRSVLPVESVQHAPNRGSHLFVCQAPLPPLPRDLPDVATYLQMLLVTSRQMADTTGIRRLSKLVDKHYPNDGDVNGTMEAAPSRKMGGLFSKVMPRRRDKPPKRSGKSGRGGDVNEESYDLVTPFRLDS